MEMIELVNSGFCSYYLPPSLLLFSCGLSTLPSCPGCKMRRLPSLKLLAPGSGSFLNYLFCQTQKIIASVFCYISYVLPDSICIISLNAQIDR